MADDRVRIIFDEDGYPRELIGSADRERAIRTGSLTPDTPVILYRAGARPVAATASHVEELRELFEDLPPRPPPPAPPAAPSPPPPPDPPNARAAAPPRPRPAVPILNAISAAYSRVVSGCISRSAFTDFFDQIGRSGPVEIIDGGRAIEAASSGASFLTCVNAGSAYLVFPSYDFIANQAIQFATIASVPENVAAIFSLERGDGGLILDRPAIYEDSETGLRIVTKGEIRGFGG